MKVEYTYKRSELVRKKVVSRTVTREPVVQVIYQGTKEIAKKEEPNNKPESKPESKPSSSYIYSPTEYQKDMVQATTQIAIDRNGYKDDTSSQIKNWNITTHAHPTDTNITRWMAVTEGKTNGRIKVMFDWSGKDEDDLILVYLLIGGKEIVNNI